MKSEITKLTKAKGMHDSLELQPKLLVFMVSTGSRVPIPLRIHFLPKYERVSAFTQTVCNSFQSIHILGENNDSKSNVNPKTESKRAFENKTI